MVQNKTCRNLLGALQGALNSSPNAAAFVVISASDRNLGLLANLALQGKEPQGATMCSPDSYSLHIPATAKNSHLCDCPHVLGTDKNTLQELCSLTTRKTSKTWSMSREGQLSW